MQTFEIRHFRSIACLGQRLEACLDEVGDATAQNGLFAEKVGFALFAEVGFDDAAAPAAHAAGIGKGDVMGVAA